MTSPHSPIPAGDLVTVPVDPTKPMVAAALNVDWTSEDEIGVAVNVWHAMVAASPAHATGAAMRESLRPGDIEPHDDVERTVNVVRHAYHWTVDQDGRVCGLVAGDMGYESTHIVLDLEELREALWLKPAALSSPAPEGEAERRLSDVLMELGTDTGMARDDVVAAMRDHPEFASDILDFAINWYLTPDPAPEGEAAQGIGAREGYIKAATLTDRLPAGSSARGMSALIVGYAYEWSPFGIDQWTKDVSLHDPLVHGGVRRYRDVRPLFAAPPSVKQEEAGRS